jgi:hypothetical protein
VSFIRGSTFTSNDATDGCVRRVRYYFVGISRLFFIILRHQIMPSKHGLKTSRKHIRPKQSSRVNDSTSQNIEGYCGTDQKVLRGVMHLHYHLWQEAKTSFTHGLELSSYKVNVLQELTITQLICAQTCREHSTRVDENDIHNLWELKIMHISPDSWTRELSATGHTKPLSSSFIDY